MSGTYRRRFAAFVIVLSGIIAAPSAFAEATYSFNLPEQSLADSLRAIGQQTEINILFEPEAVKNTRSPALRGQYTVDEAIRLVLAGTKLEGQHTAASNVVIRASIAGSGFSGDPTCGQGAAGGVCAVAWVAAIAIAPAASSAALSPWRLYPGMFPPAGPMLSGLCRP